MNKKIIMVMMCLVFVSMFSNVNALYDQLSAEIKLTDNTGAILSGTYNFSFNIYDVYTGGISLYESNQTLTTDSTGLVSVILKNVDLNFSSNYYIGVIIGSDPESTPRINLTDVGTAIRTKYLDGIGDYNNISAVYADISGDTFTGTVNFNGTSRFRSFVFIDDIEGTTHHINTDLENLDELYSDIFLTPLIINTFNNATGDYINITTDQGEVSISVNIATDVSADNYRLQYDNIILELTNGTNESPVLNYVYVYLVDGTPTWTVSTSEPTVHHAMAAKVLLGNSGTNPYAASLNEDGQIAHIKNTQETFKKQGLTYLSGLNYVATQTDLEVNNGSYIDGVGTLDVFGPVNVTEGFYLIHTNGTYAWYDNFNDIIKYSDGETIGANKYFNVVFGITPYDGTGNIYAVVQSKPTTEYTSTVLAWADESHTLSVYPSDSFLKIFFLPVARMIIQEGGIAQLLPQGDYAADYRGGIAGGVASGGGVTEVDPIWITEKTDYFTKSDILGFNYWNDTYATFNKTYADTLYRLDSWDNFTGIPTATPSNGDTTHLSTADQIYDWVIGLAYATTTYADSLGNWTADKSDYWNTSTDLDTVISDDEISEGKIAFSTACAAGNHYYLNGNDLACEADADTQLTEEQTQDFAWNVLGGTQTLISVTYQDLTNDVDFVINNDLELYDWINVSDSDIPDAITVTGYMQDEDINTFSELQSWVSDKTLLNEEDIFTIDANWVNTANPWDIETETNLVAGAGLQITSGQLFVGTGTALTVSAGSVGVTSDAIGDTQLSYNTGQHLTTTSDVTFNNATVDHIVFENDATHHIRDNSTCIILTAGSTTLEICE